MKRICREQYEKDFDEMFKLDKKGLMTDIDCYVSNLENSIERLEEQNKELKKQLEENKDKINWYENFEINKTIDKLRIKHNNQQKEFIEYLENEKDRLARECSQIYEDDLGKTRLVNEDIFNEVDKISSKFKEIIGGKDEDI